MTTATKTTKPPKWWGRIDEGPGRLAELAWSEHAAKLARVGAQTPSNEERAALGIPPYTSAAEIRARARAVREKWAAAERRKNPGNISHAIPAKVTCLGRALDLVCEDDGARSKLSLRGCLLLAPPDAFQRAPGSGRIYIVRGKLEDTREPNASEKGAEAFKRWHSRAADLVGYVDTPPPAGVLLGRGVRIGYASDKWNRAGRSVDYEHDFTAPGPLVYSTGEERPRALVLVGGRFTVTNRGIVD